MRKTILNDCHSMLNPTPVAEIAKPRARDELRALIRDAAKCRKSIIPHGGRHSMGGQQFGTDAIAVDTRELKRIRSLDQERGIVDVEAGITWPELVGKLNAISDNRWSIAQKQTGADRMTLGGSLSSNIHGRCLNKGPIIEEVESITLLNAQGELVDADRETNAELFQLAIGGYGLFGNIESVRLRLVPRQKLQRVVRVMETDTLTRRFAERTAQGYLFGDFQFAIDHQSQDFLKTGIFSCYRPAPETAEISPETKSLSEESWLELLYLAHVDKSRGFATYRDHYLNTDGQIYWSDQHQFTTYVDGYHKILDERMGSRYPGSEMITELYVPHEKLTVFMDGAREDLRRHGASLIYGTIRSCLRDRESFLAWAREDWACVIFNLCVEHSASGIQRAKKTFRALIDRALAFGGSFYLTYHRFAKRSQIEVAYPQFRKFLQAKQRFDPDLIFQSDWWRHHERLFGDA